MINKKLSYVLQNQNIPYRSRQIIDLLVNYYSEDISLTFLSNTIGISKFNIIKNFKKDLGISPMKWLWIYRTVLSAKFIEDYQQWNIKEIATSCGFGSIEHHCRCFKKIFKRSPTNYKKDYITSKGATTILNNDQDQRLKILETFIKNVIKTPECNNEDNSALSDTIGKISYAIEQSIHKSVVKTNRQ